MPYLTYDNKEKLIERLFPESAGELNYCLTLMCQRYFSKSKRNYEAHNAVIGALECAKQEFYRRQVIGYEEEKIKANGDVY